MKRRLICGIRKCWVQATPEERVRQYWLYHLVHHLKFPKELIVIEKKLKELPHLSSSYVPDRRVDILCYGQGCSTNEGLFPLLLIECKQEEIGIKTMEQVIGYNHFVKAPFIAIAGDEKICLGYFNTNENQYAFLDGLPSYQELKEWILRSQI